MTNTVIRPIQQSDYENWDRLFEAYAQFYKMDTDIDKRKVVWKWLFDEAHVTNCVVADVDGKIAGIAHFRSMPSQLRAAEIGFLDDLYVDDAYRCKGIARKLIRHVEEIGKQKGWSCLRWLTAEDNYHARSTYDRLAHKTEFLLYNMNID